MSKLLQPAELGLELKADNAIVWHEDDLYLLDQRLLPQRGAFLPLRSLTEVAKAIRDMVVRGAPAIGVTAAYGLVLAARERYAESPIGWFELMQQDFDQLAAARPTAVNLFWAIERIRGLAQGLDGNPEGPLLAEARRIHAEDIAANRRIGDLGADLIRKPTAIITHCNAGALATGGYGTALGVIRSAHAQGKVERVYADETRPWLQGARLTAWELVQDGIPVSLMADGAAAARMREGGIGWVVVGSDRIAANGDVANKIGTYGLAIAARHHGVKFMVAAPTSTIDMGLTNGGMIPIETRASDEVFSCGGQRVASEGAHAWNPVFDVTPAELVDAIVTEKGIVLKPDAGKLARLVQKG
ncbi:MAG: S-methyl-5-thioribose-1-phosphate isomerase [Gammaproteobacteria bacterium SHHR-1]|uniref:S-methyl-5-thioribose-1-phosphate isomerase n=1 Tax=Magnetovirga frankeli TaxID=947516 RepID=UPI00129356A9|nr:S-methyl-5-thioribose-1-phosphate isomerase [gamma proteobacterium SS-5]